MSVCTCGGVKHAVTKDERDIVQSNIDYCLRNQDAQGLFVAMSKLMPCPSCVVVIERTTHDTSISKRSRAFPD